jgi:hypothetical protein
MNNVKKTPDFVSGKATEKVFDNGGKIINVWIPFDEAQRINKDGNLNFDIKTSKKGTLYIENSSWKPNQTNQVRQDINEQDKIQSDLNNFDQQPTDTKQDNNSPF